LRVRLERALDLPEGVVVSETGALRPAHPAPGAARRRRGLREPHAGESGGRARGVRGPRQGDIGYASLWVPDIGRAAAFYAAVFGWAYEPSHNPHDRQVPGATPPQGLWGA